MNESDCIIRIHGSNKPVPVVHVKGRDGRRIVWLDRDGYYFPDSNPNGRYILFSSCMSGKIIGLT